MGLALEKYGNAFFILERGEGLSPTARELLNLNVENYGILT